MLKSEIKTKVLKIKNEGEVEQDDEVAHVSEDQLRSEFIKWIASAPEGVSEEVAEKAVMILVTDNFDFARWCA